MLKNLFEQASNFTLASHSDYKTKNNAKNLDLGDLANEVWTITATPCWSTYANLLAYLLYISACSLHIVCTVHCLISQHIHSIFYNSSIPFLHLKSYRLDTQYPMPYMQTPHDDNLISQIR